MFGKKKRVEEEEQLSPHEMGPPVEFKAKGGSETQNQTNLMQVRQCMGIVPAKVIFADCLIKGADRILLEYTREGVACRTDIDGMWHVLPPMDRPNGDLMLEVLKKLANLNPKERRAAQKGEFGASYREKHYTCEIASQGTNTGEQVVVKIHDLKKSFASLTEIGMRERLQHQYKLLVGRHMEGDGEQSLQKGLFVYSAPPGGGLTTLWKVGLGATDRYMRDFVGIEDKNKREPEIENVEVFEFDGAAGENPISYLPKILLKQPEVFVVPDMVDAASFNKFCELINDDDHMVFTSVRARDTSEALLRLLMLKPNPQAFAQAVTGVVNVRLIRKLCEACKQPYQPHPQLLQKLGIPPGRVAMLYREWQPPPPSPEPPDAKKKKGEDEEPQICQLCNGLGYRGRTGIFELMVVNDAIRQALVKQPDVNVIRQLSRQAGNRSLQEEGILLVAQGVTSLPELQRVLK
jgi:type II secretory ATPase GspE/PulE/Tfp pilus assembly ATPase PilB-like protein